MVEKKYNGGQIFVFELAVHLFAKWFIPFVTDGWLVFDFVVIISEHLANQQSAGHKPYRPRKVYDRRHVTAETAAQATSREQVLLPPLISIHVARTQLEPVCLTR